MLKYTITAVTECCSSHTEKKRVSGRGREVEWKTKRLRHTWIEWIRFCIEKISRGFRNVFSSNFRSRKSQIIDQWNWKFFHKIRIVAILGWIFAYLTVRTWIWANSNVYSTHITTIAEKLVDKLKRLEHRLTWLNSWSCAVNIWIYVFAFHLFVYIWFIDEVPLIPWGGEK